MKRDFFDPEIERQIIVLVDSATLRKAERLIESWEACNEEGAEIPFNNILDRVTGCDPRLTDYILEVPAKCPNCRRQIFEKTLSSQLYDAGRRCPFRPPNKLGCNTLGLPQPLQSSVQ
jgi:hypothetical protein